MDFLSILMLVMCLSFGLIVAYILFKDKLKAQGNKIKNTDKTSSSIKKEKTSKGDVPVCDSQNILDFNDIRVCNEETGLIEPENNTYVGVIEISGINFNLLSIDERLMLEESFGELLNGIDFPIQFFIQSRKTDMDRYVNRYEEKINKLKKELESLKENENTPEDVINNKQNQLNYGENLLQYISYRTVNANLLERKYYITVKYTHNYASYEHQLDDYEILTNAYNDISNKAALIIESLSRNKLSGRLLSALELGEFLYTCYNRDDANCLKFMNAIKSKFDHLVTTAKPVVIKKMEREIEKSKAKEEELMKEIEDMHKEMEVNGINV